jgi:transposase, IS30 family
MKTYRHLDYKARDRIEALRDAGVSQVEIAKIIGVDKSTISRELRNRGRKDGTYGAAGAEAKARVRRTNSKYQGMKVEAHPVLKAHIMHALQSLRSPDEIAGRLRRDGVTPRIGANAIYKWLYSPFGQQYVRYLCTRRYTRKKQRRLPKRETIPNRIPLLFRPVEGMHAEGDTFLSKRGSLASGFLASVIDTKLLVGTLIPNRHADTVLRAVRHSLSGVSVDTLTLDNGTENVLHELFQLLTFFCDPHSPWQKPHVEGGIGLTRRWFLPKGTDLSTVSEATFQSYLVILNHKWRKSLGYRSAYEVSLERGIIKKAPERALATVALQGTI